MSDHFLAMNAKYHDHYKEAFPYPGGMKGANDDTKTSWPRTRFMKFKDEDTYNNEDDLRFIIRKVNIDYNYNKVPVLTTLPTKRCRQNQWEEKDPEDIKNIEDVIKQNIIIDK